MDTRPTDCEWMYNAILRPDVMQTFLNDPDGMTKLVHCSFARDEIDVYDEVDLSKRPELKQDGKVVIITGAGRGIGQAIALVFAKANARAVCICSRTAIELEETRELLRQANDETEIYTSVTNIAKEREVEAFFSAVQTKFGTPDVVVSNAGALSPFDSITESDTTSWWNNFEVNLKGTYLVSKQFARMLRDGAGTLINISSCHALAAVPHESDYAISKLAAMRLMETMHIGYPNIRIFSIHPGAVDTDMARSVQISVGVDLRWNWTSPELAAAACLWLTTEKADFLRGRWFSANWRIDDLEEKKDEILSKNLLKTSFNMKIGL